MLFSTTLALLAISAHADTSPSPTAVIIPPNTSNWSAGTPAIHGEVKDQGDVGFCWANAWTSYLESKVLIEQHRSINLSSMYVGRAHMAHQFIDTLDSMNNQPITNQNGLEALSRYQELKKNPVELAATQQFLIRKFQKYSRNNLEGFSFTNANHYGVVPVSAYEKDHYPIAPLGPTAGYHPPYENGYSSPKNEKTFQNFIQNHLLETSDMERYLADDGIVNLETDFDHDLGNTEISEYSTFTYEGKEYTPRSFLKNYIGFDATQFTMPTRNVSGITFNPETKKTEIQFEPMPISKSGLAMDSDFNEIVQAIQGELDQRRPVLLGLLLMDDVDNNNDLISIGVLDPAYCKNPNQCTQAGGHAVMAVNYMKNSKGEITAFIVQNSWGPQGLDENGKRSMIRAKRGFNIVTMDYLKAAIPMRGYSFKYMMM